MLCNTIFFSILVSGESGAGKTETVKILMGHIAHISGKLNATTIDKVHIDNNINSKITFWFTSLIFEELSKAIPDQDPIQNAASKAFSNIY
jgi:ABC-type dipeptide/oligopeptide/nickel transport system ATPase subunit